jgi:hypothetical protein
MAGAAFAVHPQWEARSGRDANLRAGLGLALLIASSLVIGSGWAYPGWRALLPVIATCLFMSAGPRALFNRAVLADRRLVFVGLISYPLYLWHWPLLSLLRIANNGAPLTPARALVLFAAAFVLAWLTYVLLERPIRRGVHGRASAAIAAIAMVCVGSAGLAIALDRGVPSREVNSRDPTFAARDGRNAADVRAWLLDDCRVAPEQAKLFQRCKRDSRGTERFALIGDSKAEALWAGLVRTSTPQGRWMFIGGSTNHDAVLPVLTDSPTFGPYKTPSRAALQALQGDRNVDTVVIAAATRSLFHLHNAWTIEDLPASPFYDDTFESVAPFVRQLLAGGKRVVFVVDNPTFPDPTRCMRDARVTWHGWIGKFLAIGHPDVHCEITIDRQGALAAQYRRFLNAVRAIAPDRISLFETQPYLCDMVRRRCASFDGSTFLYSFADHVSDEASTRIGRALNEHLVRDGAAAGPGHPAP